MFEVLNEWDQDKKIMFKSSFDLQQREEESVILPSW
jgi:hypothetical protein